MNKNRPLIRVDKRIVAEMAWHKAVIEGKAFTADDMATWCHMPPNRHLRGYLIYLASVNLLERKRRLCDDGHYRKFYFANFDKMKARFTPPMFELDEEMVS